MKRETLIQLVVLVLFSKWRISWNDTTICSQNQTDQSSCCQDYKNVSGKCEACFGSWGKNCENDCAYGFYGHGCRKKCSCNSQQECDKKQGCIEPSFLNKSEFTSGENTTKDSNGLETLYISVGVAVVLILILSCILYLYFQKKSGEIKKKGHKNTGGTIDRQIDDQSSTYSDTRGSLLVNPADDTLFHYTLPRQISNENDRRFQSLTCKNRERTKMCDLKRSRPLEQNVYGIQSTDYNHLSFKLQTSAKNTPSEEAYDFYTYETNPVPSTPTLMSKDALKNTSEEDPKPAYYIDVTDTCYGYACSSDVSQTQEYYRHANC